MIFKARKFCFLSNFYDIHNIYNISYNAWFFLFLYRKIAIRDIVIVTPTIISKIGFMLPFNNNGFPPKLIEPKGINKNAIAATEAKNK